MRRRPPLTEAIGTDSFLDIVANLVGILLILLMVIGARMDDASESSTAVADANITTSVTASVPVELPPLELPEILEPDVEAAQLEYNRVQISVQEAEAEAERLVQLMQVQKRDRDNLMLAIAMAENELQRRRAELDENKQAQVQSGMELQKAEEAYQSILGQIESLQVAMQEQKPDVIQHISTPIAKTVFVREEHFRLKAGRLLFVPLNEMTAELRSEAPNKVWKLKQARQITETIGPSQGFQMQYTLQRNRVPVQTESGLRAVREVVELERFVMVPVGDAQGETVERAMEPDSDFRRRLAGWDPRETIVTVWTYRDSFGEFRELKSKLYEMGFLTAARPLPENQLISGSPDGTRSAAQ